MLALPLYDDSATTRPPVITGGLIAACSIVFLWQIGLGGYASNAASLSYGMVPAVLFGYAELPTGLHAVPPAATLDTSMFLHGGLLHLLGNMLYLWIFGKGVETALGSFRFLIFYLLCGVAAGLTQALTDPVAEVPMIGASGAIAGTLGAYLVLRPRGNVAVLIWIIIFVRVITLPAVILLGICLLGACGRLSRRHGAGAPVPAARCRCDAAAQNTALCRRAAAIGGPTPRCGIGAARRPKESAG